MSTVWGPPRTKCESVEGVSQDESVESLPNFSTRTYGPAPDPHISARRALHVRVDYFRFASSGQYA